MADTIDSHHHLWRYNNAEFGWISGEMQVLRRDFLPHDLAHEMASAGVDGAIAVQARQTIEETHFLLNCAEQTPTIRGVVGWLPIGNGNIPAALAGLGHPHKLKGLRHVIQDEPDDNFILGEDFNFGIASMLRTGLVYEILIHERHLPQAAIFAARHPQQTFVLDHLAKPRIASREIEPWQSNLAALASHANVCAKLSGLVTEAAWDSWAPEDLHPYLDAAAELFGPERLMAGSDWPVCLLASGYEQWWATLREWMKRFDNRQQKRMLGETAEHIYNL